VAGDKKAEPLHTRLLQLLGCGTKEERVGLEFLCKKFGWVWMWLFLSFSLRLFIAQV